jgi:hypothetical protein
MDSTVWQAESIERNVNNFKPGSFLTRGDILHCFICDFPKNSNLLIPINVGIFDLHKQSVMLLAYDGLSAY